MADGDRDSAPLGPARTSARPARDRLGVGTSAAILTSVGVDLGAGDGAERETRVPAAKGNRQADNRASGTGLTGGVWM